MQIRNFTFWQQTAPFAEKVGNEQLLLPCYSNIALSLCLLHRHPERCQRGCWWRRWCVPLRIPVNALQRIVINTQQNIPEELAIVFKTSLNAVWSWDGFLTRQHKTFSIFIWHIGSKMHILPYPEIIVLFAICKLQCWYHPTQPRSTSSTQGHPVHSTSLTTGLENSYYLFEN